MVVGNPSSLHNSLPFRTYPKFDGFSPPDERRPWRVHECGAGGSSQSKRRGIDAETIREYARNKLWLWPERRVCFFSDLHADPGAFMRSLEMAGLAWRCGDRPVDFDLTDAGRDNLIVIGGDCLNKGPANLALLDMIAHLRQLGATVVLLAGNHDVRILVGIAHAGRCDDPGVGHLLVRMGKGSVAFFREVLTMAIEEGLISLELIRESEARDFLFPSPAWFKEYVKAARGRVSKRVIERELQRVRESMLEFEMMCHGHGLSLAHIVAALEVCRKLFLTPGGRYHWFQEELRLAHREGALLFLHAGLDDSVAGRLAHRDIAALNAEFRNLLEHDPFTLYTGPIGNVFRTRYKPLDLVLTRKGVGAAHAAGVYATFHGHRRSLEGQRAVFREGLLHFECDSSVDSNTRRKQGLSHPGGAATIIEPDGQVLGISTDCSFVKEFDAGAHAGLLTYV